MNIDPAQIPLTLYAHIPWCVEKCPYCDFNSHPLRRQTVDQTRYVDAMLADLAHDLPLVGERPLTSIFIGGGTPSLFSGEAIGRLLSGIGQRIALTDDCEITLEANPGTVDSEHFAGYRAAGVNRLSIGVQSFDDAALQRLGRIHDRAQARTAFITARNANFASINLDLMFGLPGQSLQGALADLTQAIALGPEHISWYQLTLEPNTGFAHRPPAGLPQADAIADWQGAGIELLAEHGYRQYEVSAFARDGRQCRHNRNYWQFGDYLGIGAGAHAKLTLAGGDIERRARLRHPRQYLSAGPTERIVEQRRLDSDDRRLEFMMNALRLCDGFDFSLFEQRTGLPHRVLDGAVQEARSQALLETRKNGLCPTDKGRLFLDNLLQLFLPEEYAK